MQNGIVAKIKPKTAIIFNGKFVEIKRDYPMKVGELVFFFNEDIVRGKDKLMTVAMFKYSPLVAGIAALIIFSVMFLKPFHHKDIYSYVDIDINPSIEFQLDSGEVVVKAIPINEDAKQLLSGMKVTDEKIDLALTHVINKSEEMGYLKKGEENTILVTGSLSSGQDNSEGKLNQMLLKCQDVIKKMNPKYNSKILKISPEIRQQSIQNNISMGRQATIIKAREAGLNLTVEQVEKQSVSEIINILDTTSANDNNIQTVEENQTNIQDNTPSPTKEQQKDESSAVADVKPTEPLKATPEPSDGGNTIGTNNYNIQTTSTATPIPIPPITATPKPTYTPKPKPIEPLLINGESVKIEAENYTAMSGTGIGTSTVGEGNYVGWIEAGDWTAYSVNILSEGMYKVDFRYAGNCQGIQILGDDNILGSVRYADTGGWDVWGTASTNIYLKKGIQTLKVLYSKPGINFNYMVFTKYQSAPTKVEAENFNTMSGIGWETCSEGTLDIGWADDGDWLEYSVYIPEAAEYRVDFRIASAQTGIIQLQEGGSTIGTLDVQNTGGYQVWETASMQVKLTQGLHKYKIYYVKGGINLNYLNFVKYQ